MKYIKPGLRHGKGNLLSFSKGAGGKTNRQAGGKQYLFDGLEEELAGDLEAIRLGEKSDSR